MTQDELAKKLTEIETQLSEAVAKLDTAEAIAKAYQELETEDRNVFATFSKQQQEEYVKADAETREQLLSKAQEEIEKKAQPPELSEEVRKRFDAIEKRAQEAESENKALQARIAKAEDERQLVELTKRAETSYPNLPGTPAEKGQVLKSLQCPCLTDDHRAAIEKLFAAGNAALGQLGKPVGGDTKNAGISKSWDTIEKRAVALATEQGQKVSAEQAVASFLNTTEGKTAYREYLSTQGEQ